MGRSTPSLGVPRPAPSASAVPTSGPSKRARKDRGPNWLPSEVFALISAKREMFLEELDTVDGRDLMTPESSKWHRISMYVMQSGFSPCMRDGPACKTKWNQMIPDYKKVADYLSRTGRNSMDYWEMNSTERKAESLPRLFAQDVFEAIHEWYGNRPQIQPPHIRDLLSPNDGNYRTQQHGRQQEEEVQSEPDTEDPSDMPHPDPLESTEDSSPPRSPRRSSTTPTRAAGQPDPVQSPGFRPTPGLPPGVHPQVISSSDTSAYAVHKRPGNTAVRRKSLSGHSVIAEATKATGSIMAAQMQEIADSSRELERSKIEVQLKLFSEQMAYQREKDRRMYENATVANENARLSILKQGEMVNCLSQLSSVLSHGLTMSSRGGQSPVPQGGHIMFATANGTLLTSAQGGSTARQHGGGHTNAGGHTNERAEWNTGADPASTATPSPVNIDSRDSAMDMSDVPPTETITTRNDNTTGQIQD